MNLDQIRLVHTALAANDWISAAQLVLIANEIQSPLAVIAHAKGMTERQFADETIRTLFQNLVLAGDYRLASALIWDKELFYQEAESVERILRAAKEHDMLLCMGASSLGKSYNLIACNVLEWLIDPYYTAVKLTSQTEGHLQTNVWPHMIDMVRHSVIQPKEEWQIKEADMWLGIKGTSMLYGFSGIAFKQSQTSSGSWQGFKTQPKRPKTDPLYHVFGSSTRLFVGIDEASQVPEGSWNSLNSILGTMGDGLTKMWAAFNPVDVSTPVVVRAEPPEGWSSEQLETLYSYLSKHGWWVERLDAARCENVVKRKVIFKKLMTYEAFLGFLSGGGDNSPRYYVFARGYPPLRDAANTIIPPDWLQTQRGEALYIDKVEHWAAFDLAYQGADKAAMGVGRWGLASGWRNASGRTIYFEDRLNPGKRKARHVLTIDQLIPMPKHRDTVSATQEMMGRCKIMNIKPECTGMDMTGNALGTFSHASKYWGNVHGISWGAGSSDTIVVAGDKAMASELYEGVPSEMWFRFKRWLDPVVCAVLINPIVPTAPLNSQLTSRRFRFVKNQRMRIESKDEYKARNGGLSPDEADTIVMLVDIVAKRGGVVPGIMEQQDRSQGRHSENAIKIDESANAHGPMDMGATDGVMPMQTGSI